MTDNQNRPPNCDRQGRPYEGTLAERADKAMGMIGKMCAEGRPPRMAVPAGSCVHWTPCGDEDIFIVDLLHDLLQAPELAELARQYADDGMQTVQVAAAKKSFRKLLHAAFHLMDDSEEGPDGMLSIDCEIGQRDLLALNEALDELGVDSHEDIDRVMAAAPVPAYCCAACGLTTSKGSGG